jgi:hypothetical protein
MIVDPLQELFQGKTIDFLLMAHKEELFSDIEKRRLKSKVANLFEFFQENNMGLMLFEFYESKSQIKNIADHMISFRNSLDQNKKKLSEIELNAINQSWFEDENLLYLLKGKRFQKILEKINGSYKTVYGI